MFVCFQFTLNEGSIHDCLYYNMIQYVNMIDYFPDVIIVFCILREVLDLWKTGILDVFGNAPALLRGFINTLSLDNSIL